MTLIVVVVVALNHYRPGPLGPGWLAGQGRWPLSLVCTIGPRRSGPSGQLGRRRDGLLCVDWPGTLGTGLDVRQA